MRILITNNKGGQGKTFFSVLLYQYLKEQRITVRACDLDRKQLNFAQILSKWAPEEKIIPMFEAIPANALTIIDTGPFNVNSEDEIQIIQEVERVIVPIEVDASSARGLEQVAKIRGDKDIMYLATRWDSTNPRQQNIPYDDLMSKGYVFTSRVPRNRIVGYNVDNGITWHKSLPVKAIDAYNDLLNRLTSFEQKN